MSGGMHVGRARAALDVAVQVAGRALNLIPGVVVTVLLARTLGDDSFGQWSTALAVVQIGATIGDFGLEQVAVRKAAAERGREHEWIGALLTLRLAIAVPVTLGAALVQLLLADSTAMGAAGLLLCGTLLIAPFSVTRATFQLRVRNDLSVLVMTVNSLLWTAAVVAIALGDNGMVAFAAAFLGAALLSTLLEVWLAFRMSRPQLRRSTALWRELARIGVPVGLGGLLVMGYVKLDQILLFALAGAEDAGLYGAVYRILDQAQFVPIAMMTTVFPIMAASWPSDPFRVRRLGQLVIDYLAMVSLPALGFTIVASEPLVRLLFGEDFIDAAAALPILMAAFAVICFGYLGGNLVVLLELQRLFVRNAAHRSRLQRRSEPAADSALRLPCRGLGDARHRDPRNRADPRRGPPESRAEATAQASAAGGGCRRRDDARGRGPAGAGRPGGRPPRGGRARLSRRPAGAGRASARRRA